MTNDDEELAPAPRLILDLDDPAEVLAYLPHRFGYPPRESLVVLSVVPGPDRRSRLGLSARLDLRDAGHPQPLGGVLGHLAAEGSGGIRLVFYADAAAGAAWRVPARVRQVLRTWCAASDLVRIRETLLVHGDRFRCLSRCAHEPACPRGGRPVTELAGTAIAAGLVLAGSFVHAERADLAALPTPAPAALARASARYRRALTAGPPSGATALRAWRRALARVDAAAPGDPDTLPGPEDCGYLAATLEDRTVRDAVLVAVVHGLAPEPSLGTFDAIDTLLGPGAPQPTPSRVWPRLEVLRAIAGHAEPGAAAPALAVWGWAAWWCGEGARAAEISDRCLRDDPQHRLGRLLACALDGGLRPPWVSVVQTPPGKGERAPGAPRAG